MSAFYWPFCEGNQQWLMDSPHKWPVMQKAFPCYDIMCLIISVLKDGELTHHQCDSSSAAHFICSWCNGDPSAIDNTTMSVYGILLHMMQTSTNIVASELY